MVRGTQSLRARWPRMRRTRLTLILAVGGPLLGLALAWAAPSGAGSLYRWTDPNGVTVYSERPPPGVEATRLTPDPGPSAAETERARERIRSLLEEDLDRQEEAKRQAQESSGQAELQARRRTNCEAARRNLAALENPQIARVRTADGEVQALSEETRTRYLEEARKVIQRDCD